MRKLPFNFCVSCGKKTEEVGGRRIVWCYKSGIILATTNDKFDFHSIESSHAYIHKFSSDNRLLFVWGNWTIGLFHEIYEEFENVVRNDNKRPWICQKCAEHTLCFRCGEPLVDAPGSQVLRDDGSITFVPGLGVIRPCSNPNCIRSK